MQAIGMSQSVVVVHRLLAIGVLSLIAIGCQQKPTTVTGTVTLDGRPLSIAEDARGTIVFQPVSGQGTTATGLLDAAGIFKLASGASSDVAPGKYQVAVSVVQLLPTTEGAEQSAKRISPAKYASANSSEFEANVLPGSNELKFDMLSKADDGAAGPPASGSVPSGAGSKPQDRSSQDK
jgi:hypothetical protein